MDNQTPIYYGLFLDDESRDKLSKLAPREACRIFCDHMTIAFKNNFTPDVIDACERLVGKRFTLKAVEIATDENVTAVKVVTSCPSLNSLKHVTISTNSPTAKPVQSNELTDWQRLETPVTLQGIVKPYMPTPRKLTEGDIRAVINEAIHSVLESMNIKPENRGKFTQTKERTGKTTSQLLHSKNKKTKARANFARMANRHWKPLPKK